MTVTKMRLGEKYAFWIQELVSRLSCERGEATDECECQSCLLANEGRKVVEALIESRHNADEVMRLYNDIVRDLMKRATCEMTPDIPCSQVASHDPYEIGCGCLSCEAWSAIYIAMERLGIQV